jgi:hypothetical protein
MKRQIASRKRVKIKMSISSPTGFGKTKSALLLAYGITGNWEKICVIDSENRSASLYSTLGPYNTIEVEPPYTIDKLEHAFRMCIEAGDEVVIVDSAYHYWQGVLDYVDSMGGGFQNWKKGSPMWQRLINLILQSDVHVISTIRKKQAYALTEGDNGKKKVEKKGMEDQVRDGFDYEMTIAFDLINDLHMAKAMKDRTEMFDNRPEFVITPATGKMIKEWCELGKEPEKQLQEISMNAYNQAYARIKGGEVDLLEKIKSSFIISESQLESLLRARDEAIKTKQAEEIK